MKPWGIVALTTVALVAGVAGYFATRPEGSSYTDADAERTAECLAKYPMPADAAGFARRLQDRYSLCGSSDVLEYSDIGDRLADTTRPSVRLVIRIHHDAYSAWFTHRDAITACYRMEFDYYGLVDGHPDRVACPPGAAALTPPPVPRKGLPSTMGDVVRRTLEALPPAPAENEVRAAIQAALPPPVVNPPTLDVAVRDSVVAVAAGSTDRGELECQFAVRTATGEVDLWFPDRSKVPVSEFRCDAATALHRHPAEAG
ncbi:hypothetical protein SAMN05216188_11147 [Lentzea xinjiangensis]|uniref:Uncharacterized protein n=1 Tax=Lentzea xinjiangensis TaxID=402600 RepID=A0A1H9NXC6_9PSEU|nr:hypothetical protein [Lentzea xinjiangensis]SER40636.1 hypothetical protein SAMN05216188_11147 [Lentzea xinjiangensis]